MDYQLMLFDTPLAEFKIRKGSVKQPNEIKVKILEKPDLFPMPLRNHDDFTRKLDFWLSNRITMIGRRLVKKIRKLHKIQDPVGILDITHGLSLTDAYWIRNSHDAVRWDDINLYTNDFSEMQGILLSGQELDVQGRCLSPDFTTDGRMRKSWIRDARGIFLVKSDMRTGLLSQSTNEWFAAQAADAFGIDHVHYDLKAFGKDDLLASECPIFTSEDCGFVNAYNYLIAQGWNTSSLRLDSLGNIETHEEISRYIAHYEDMMAFDFLIGNIDRHLGNFGLMIDNHTGEIIGPAPLFDHGKAFFADEPSLPNDPERWAEYEAQISTFLSPEEQMSFIRPRHAEGIQRLLEYEFIQHDLFPVTDKEIELVSKFCHHQCEKSMNHLKTRCESQCEMHC